MPSSFIGSTISRKVSWADARPVDARRVRTQAMWRGVSTTPVGSVTMPDTAQTISTPAEGFRETIESIVIALILAFVFRAFIVEAFVIPTGSMAPTLYGAHGTIVCDDCGTEFAYGLRDPSSRRGNVDVVTTTKVYCPNCRYPNTNLETSDGRGNPESGDRILVLKWPFDIGVPSLGPARWDVTVFKNPKDGSTNFIKRLAGLPGEVLMIVGGDVYAAPTSDLSESTVAELDKLRHGQELVYSPKPIQSFQLVIQPPGSLKETCLIVPIREPTQAEPSKTFNVRLGPGIPARPSRGNDGARQHSRDGNDSRLLEKVASSNHKC